ncbi:hypothetical protein H2200_001936 [Cladophialophora chaetospira]|uniref:Transcription factor domain-containing protein n=1 Tax=Cladophialophora chaetospira TaxID=386627 RepID=A0AA38XLU4_9EURO|nr:hypothetical protein H2200_001936 [Cladophialophora chaetospira]
MTFFGDMSVLLGADAVHSKFDQLEKELQQLRSLVAHNQNRVTSQSTSPSNVDRNVDGVTLAMGLDASLNYEPLDLEGLNGGANETDRGTGGLPTLLVDQDSAIHEEGLGRNFMLGRSPAQQARSLEIFVLHKQQIDPLFDEYFKYYHPHLSFLDPALSPDQYFERSPLLFWTIVTTAARRYREEPSLFAGLFRAVTRLTWATISVRPHNRFMVEAILLQVAWPFPCPTIAADNSYLLISIAVQASIQLGLHLPEIHQEFSTLKLRLLPEEIKESAKTWAACNLVAQSTTAGMGYPTIARFGWTTERTCDSANPYGIPDDLRHQLMIAKFSYRVEQVMTGNATNATGLPKDTDRQVLMTLLERDLQELEMQIKAQQLSSFNQIYLEHARLNLLVYYFFESKHTSLKKEGLLKAFATASEVIARISAEDDASKFLLYAPVCIFHLLTVCAFLLLKILSSSYSQYVDFEAGKKSFNATVLALRRWSVANNDLSARIAEILALLWRGLDASSARSEVEPELRLHSRQTASLLWDGLWRWKEEFGGQAKAYPSPSNASQYATIDDQTFIDSDFFDNTGWIWGHDAQVS